MDKIDGSHHDANLTPRERDLVRLWIESGATFAGVMIGEPDDRYLLASDAGYGFVTTLGDLQSKNKSGNLPLQKVQGVGWSVVTALDLCHGSPRVGARSRSWYKELFQSRR